MITDDTEIAWAAGLLEGEGCFYLRRGTLPIVAVQMTDLDVLQRLHGVFNAGYINVTKTAKVHYKPTWVWSVSTGKDSVRIMRAILPWMAERRTTKIQEILAVYEEQLKVQADRRDRDREIVALRASGMTMQAIGDQFNLTRSGVHNVIKRYEQRLRIQIAECKSL